MKARNIEISKKKRFMAWWKKIGTSTVVDLLCSVRSTRELMTTNQKGYFGILFDKFPGFNLRQVCFVTSLPPFDLPRVVFDELLSICRMRLVFIASLSIAV